MRVGGDREEGPVFQVEPIGYVHASRTKPADDFWGGTEACIRLTDALPQSALDGIEEFSHVEVLFVFDRVDAQDIVRGARHPRNNRRWPQVGVLAQRNRNRPNRLGSTIARVLGREGRKLYVSELDAIDGTPVVDIKPVMEEFLPRDRVRQPPWSRELMRDYWLQAE
jgi:tRNA-Thr(GGU) m(6)t(6)A37 methyltransferase TsaA